MDQFIHWREIETVVGRPMLAGFTNAGEVDSLLRLPLVPLEVFGDLNIDQIRTRSSWLPRLQMKRIDIAPRPLLKESHELRILLDRSEDIPKGHVGIDVARATQHVERGRDLLLYVLPCVAVPFERLDAVFGDVDFIGHLPFTYRNNQMEPDRRLPQLAVQSTAADLGAKGARRATVSSICRRRQAPPQSSSQTAAPILSDRLVNPRALVVKGS
jgi:hypothetical protein